MNTFVQRRLLREFDSFYRTYFSAVLIFFVVGSQLAIAQIEPISNLRHGLQSPEAASLGKFGDIPVSNYTGTPNISIPLYVVESGGVELPITLDYNASGIKVNEIASWVGLGWALNSGGVITRTVRGLSDYDSYGYLTTYDALYNQDNWPISEMYLRTIAECSGGDIPCMVQSGLIDTEPDLYFYNFSGRAGKFFKGPNAVTTIPYQHFDLSGGEAGWTLITEDGTKFLFNDLEEVTEHNYVYRQSGNNGYNSRNYISSWYLSEIHPPGNSEVILLNYTIVSSASEMKEKVSEKEQLQNIYINGYGDFVKDVQYTNQQINISKPVLTSIQTSSETINFIPSSNRDDQPFGTTGLNKLKEIEITTKSGTVKKRIKLKYAYFNNTDDDARRLKLESITEFSPDSNLKGKSYSFDYIGDEPGEVSLPDYGSFAKDYWGYYNGENNNSSALPEINSLGIPGANRQPSEAHMQAGLLERINWPTGGYTEFAYESHDYSRIGNYSPTDDELQSEYVEDTKNASFVSLAHEALSQGTNNISDTQALETDFTIDGLQDVSVDINITWPKNPEDNSEVLYGFFRILDSGGSSVFSISNDSETSWSGSVELPLGTYTVQVGGVSICSTGCDADWNNYSYLYFNSQLSWIETQVDTFKPLYLTAGGVRIDSIRSSSANTSNPEQIESYEYRLSSTPARSSGVIIAEPKPYYQIENSQFTVQQRSSSSFTSLGSLGGRSIGYSEVEVTYGANSEGGRRIYHYTTAADFPDIYYPHDGVSGNNLPWLSRSSNEWRRGLMKQIKSFDNSGNVVGRTTKEYNYNLEGLSLLRGGDYTYIINEQDTHPLVEVLRGSTYIFPVSFSSYDPTNFYYPYTYITYAHQSPYYIVGGFRHPEKETSSIYDATGNSLRTSTEYIHEQTASSSAIGQLRAIIEENSNDEQRITEYEYAHEEEPSMNSLHMLSQPFSKTIKDGSGTVIKKEWTRWGTFDGDWQPCGIWLWDGTLEAGEPKAPTSCSSN